MLCGHTHKVMNIQEYSKTIWNPGSVGLPIIEEGAMKAQFMVLHGDDGAWHPEFVELDYDIERTIQDKNDRAYSEGDKGDTRRGAGQGDGAVHTGDWRM